MMWKKIAAVTLCAALVLSMAACSKGSGSSKSGSGGSDGKVVLRWMPAYLKPAVVDKYVQMFNESHDDIQVEAEEATYGSVSDYTSALALNIATGDEAYDIFSMSAADINKYINSGVAYCLDDELKDNDDIKSFAMDVITRDGHVYAYPATTDVIGLYVNLDMLEGSGHKLEDLDTWDGMLKAGADIAAKYGNYGVLTHLGFGGGYAEFLWYASMWSAGGDISTDLDGNVTVTNPEKVAKAAEQWRDLIMGDAGSVEFNNNIDYFVNGLCGMDIAGQTALSEMDGYLSGGYSFKWTFIPVPSAEKGSQKYSPIGGWFSVINARNAHTAEAVEFMNWLYFETDYIADMCRAYYQVSPLKSADKKLDDLYSTYFGMVYDYINSGEMECKAEIALDSEVLEKLGKMLSSVVYQSTTDEEALAYVNRFIEDTGAKTK